MSKAFRCLRLHLLPQVRPSIRIASALCPYRELPLRPYSVEKDLKEVGHQNIHDSHQEIPSSEPRIRIGSGPPEVKYRPDPYPRFTRQEGVIDYERFREKYSDLRRGDSRSEEVVVRGMS